MSTAALELERITAGYGPVTVLRDVNLTVAPGSVVAVLGSNGAGKTTLLRTAAGLIKQSEGQVRIGAEDVSLAAPNLRTKRGLCLIPEGRGIWKNLTVEENLRLQIPTWQVDKGLDPVLEAFPILKTRLSQRAGQLSGGQQQMVALSRAFLAQPKIAMFDEVSIGLAPIVVDQIFEALHILAQRGMALLIVEQYVDRVLDIADHAYMLNHGQVTFDGPAAELDQDEVMRHYLTHDMPAQSPSY